MTNAVHVAVSAVAAARRVAGEGDSVAGRCFAHCEVSHAGCSTQVHCVQCSAVVVDVNQRPG